MNDAFTSVTINESIVFLKDVFKDNDEESYEDKTEGGEVDDIDEDARRHLKTGTVMMTSLLLQ